MNTPSHEYMHKDQAQECKHSMKTTNQASENQVQADHHKTYNNANAYRKDARKINVI